MSVINQMLRDLETRRQHDAPAGLAELRVETQGESGRHGALQFAFGAVAVVIVAGVAAMIWVDMQGSTPHLADAAGTANVQIPVAVPAAAPATGTPVAAADIATTNATADIDSAGPATPMDAPAAVDKSSEEPVAEAAGSADSTVTAQPRAVDAAVDDEADMADIEAAAPKPLARAPVAPEKDASPGVMERTVTRLAPRERADKSYAAAVALLSSGDARAGERELKQALAADSKHVAARERLAALYVRQGRGDDAEALLAQGMAALPGHTNFAKLRADLLLKRGDLYGALNALIARLPPVERDPEYHAMVAAVLQQLGDHGQAERTYRALTGVEPREAKHWAGLAISLDQLGRGKEALDAYARARKLGLTGEVARYVDGRISALATRYR